MRNWLEDKIAVLLYNIGIQPGISTGIHGGLTYGYGELDPNGFWQYSLYSPRCRARRGRLRCQKEYHGRGAHIHTSCAGGSVRWNDSIVQDFDARLHA
jgi:hypothetical protein